MAARELADQMAAATCRRLAGANDNDREEALRPSIQQLIDEWREEDTSTTAGAERDSALLSRLLSQLELAKEEGTEQSDANLVWPNESGEGGGSATEGEESGGIAEEIVKEIRKVRRQNTITHWLLSVLIVVTTVWQFSEVSFILNLKSKVQHPFRAIGSMILAGFKGGSNRSDEEKSSVTPRIPHMDVPPLPSFKMSEIPHADLKSFLANGEG